MRRKKVMESSAGLTADVTVVNGKTENKMAEVHIATKKEYRDAECGLMVRRSNGLIDH